MTQLKVDTITDAAGTAAPDLEDGLTVNGSALSTVNTAEYTSSADEPSNPKDGAIWWDTANERVLVYVNDNWYRITLGASAAADDTSVVWYGDRAVIAGGAGGTSNSTLISNMDYFDITTSGNASDFGDISVARNWVSGVSNATYGVFIGGSNSSGQSNVIDYVTISTLGNASDFGDTVVSTQAKDALSDDTYGVYCAVHNSAAIEYITIGTSGSSSDFGDLSDSRTSSGCANDWSRGLFAGGTSASNVIDYITIQTTGNATDFGDLITGTNTTRGSGDRTYAIFNTGYAGSFPPSNAIDYVTIQTTGNATDFGDLTEGRWDITCTANGTKVAFCGGTYNDGVNGTVFRNTIDYVTVSTPSNASDFGDLTGIRARAGGASGAAS